MALDGTHRVTDTIAKKFDTGTHPVTVSGTWQTAYLHMSREAPQATALMAASVGAIAGATMVAWRTWGTCRNTGYRELDTERGSTTELRTDTGGETEATWVASKSTAYVD